MRRRQFIALLGGAANTSVQIGRRHSMMRREKFAIANIYVPIKRRATLKPETVQEIAQSILEVGHQAPILVRRDGDRYVLVHGLHRLEACKALGEETIYGYLVQAVRH
jgi:sulfiredoxin